MTIVVRGNLNSPNVTCLAADIIGGAVVGAQPGMVVFVTDTEATYIVRSDSQLVPYSLPVNVTVSSEIEIGKIVIKDDTTSTTASVGANGLAVDAYVNKIDQSVETATELSPFFDTKSVAVSGASEALTATDVYAICVTVFPKTGNVGNIYFGTSGVDKTTSQQIVLAPGSSGCSVDAPLSYKINLADFYIDAATAGDGVNFIYLK